MRWSTVNTLYSTSFLVNLKQKAKCRLLDFMKNKVMSSPKQIVFGRENSFGFTFESYKQI